jgi:hypothetical protein
MHDALIVTEFWLKKGMVLAASKLIIGRHNCGGLLKNPCFLLGGGDVYSLINIEDKWHILPIK